LTGSWLEDDLRPQLQTTSSYTVSDNVAGKSIATVRIESSTSHGKVVSGRIMFLTAMNSTLFPHRAPRDADKTVCGS
jgi:hypothetical protein